MTTRFGKLLEMRKIYTTSILKYMTLLTFLVRLPIHLFYYRQVKSKLHLTIDIMIYILVN
jgi:hypothetical protein